MIRKCIRDVIEPMGFVNEGDSTEERWVAQFICDFTGNILTFVAEESADEMGVSRILFNVCDEQGDLINTMTLDQLLVAFEQEMQIVPKKSHKVYIGVYNLRVQVPVDMGEVTQQTFDDLLRDGYITEIEIAEQCARAKLRHSFSDVYLNLINFDCEEIITQDHSTIKPNKFGDFIKDELGFIEGHEPIASQLEKLLDERTIRRLYDGTFRLLLSDNFTAEYGDDSPLVIATLKVDGCEEIILYKNPYKARRVQ